MAKARMAAWLLLGCLLQGSAIQAAQPTVADLLNYRPHQEGILYTTPSPQEQTSCTRELIKGKQRGSGWLVRDSQGRRLRLFFDTNGDGRVDVWSYYRDGVEVYRETDSSFRGKPEQFRWLNSGGMKWGVDVNGDLKIDTWKMISAEEVSQEILQALISRDFSRLQALFITDGELKTLEFSTAEVARIHELQKQAYAKFQSTLAKLTHFSDKTRWVHLETGGPQCVLAENAGTKHDLIRYARASILCETGGKNDWLQTGELIQVGSAWRIIDAPSIGDGVGEEAPSGNDPALQGLLSQLGSLDAHPPSGSDIGIGVSPELATYNLKRADLLEQIVAKVKPEEREQWIRQLADCLAAAAQSSPESEKTAYKRLQTLEEQVVTSMPKSSLAAYITFREMSAENALLAKSGMDNAKVQDKWLERLAQSYSVIGVTPKEFHDAGQIGSPDLWVPMMMHDELIVDQRKDWFKSRRPREVNLVGRLKPGVTLALANVSMQAFAQRLQKEYPTDSTGRTAVLLPLSETNVPPQQRDLFTLGGRADDGDCRVGAADCVRQRGESFAGAGDATAPRAGHTVVAGGFARTADPAIADGEFVDRNCGGRAGDNVRLLGARTCVEVAAGRRAAESGFFARLAGAGVHDGARGRLNAAVWAGAVAAGVESGTNVSIAGPHGRAERDRAMVRIARRAGDDGRSLSR